MSTSYYELASPWSSLRVDDNEVHARLHLWSDGKKAGELVVASEDAGAACRSQQSKKGKLHFFLTVAEFMYALIDQMEGDDGE